MGRQLKRKDPKKRKKAVEADSASTAEKPVEKGGFISRAKSGTVPKKNGSAGVTRKAAKPAKKDAESGIRGLVDKCVQFLREVRVELKKVTWPSRKQTIGSTAVVLLMVIMISIFLGVVDFSLSNLIRLVIG